MKLKIGMAVVEVDGAFVAVSSGGDGKVFNGMIRMNKTAAFMLDLLKNDVTEEALCDALCEKFEVERDVAARDVKTFVKTLSDAGLLV